MSKVDEALVEIQAQIDALEPQLEGLNDLDALDLGNEASNEISTAIQDYTRRQIRLNTAKVALESLVADGYPDMEVRQISADALADIQANVDTILAARAQFTSEAASSLAMSAGPARPKT